MWRLLLLVWLLLPGMAAAQVVTVRSGDHGDFTRLALTFPEPGAWDFGRTGDGYGFRARAARWRYDISTVFTLIARDRLAALWVDPDSGVLRMGLGCECHAIATPFRPGIVVIDIRPGAAPADSPFEQPLENAGRSLPQLEGKPMQRPRARPGNFLPEPPPPPLSPWYLAAPRPPAVPLPVAAPDPRAAELQSGLIRELSRGIAAGALTPAARLPAAPPAEPTAGPRVLPPEAAVPAVQMRLQPPEGAPSPVSDIGQVCIADDRLDVAAWGSDTPPAEQIAQARSRLLGEFDRPDTARVLALTRLYIHLGFGAEARALVATWAANSDERPVLEALAALVDGGLAEATFRGMASCDGRAALWAVLARPAPPDPAQTARAAVIRAFSELPLGLRRSLGIALADRFLAAGDAAAARAIRDGIGRAVDPADSALGLIEAGIDRHAGAATEAESKLSGIARSGSGLAPRALADLVDSRIRRGGAPDPEQVLELEAMLREHRGAPDEPALRRALAQSLVLTGQADRALSEFAPQDPGLGPLLWSLLAERGEEMDLAARALSLDGAARTLPPATRQAVAQRLIGAGFPDAAAPWLSGLPGPEATRLRAEAALAGRDGRLALRELAGASDPGSERIRARALELLGDLPEAQAAWQRAGDGDQAERVLFLARQWADLAAGDDPARTALLEARQGTPADPQATGELARGKALLETSRATRLAADTFVQGHPPP